MGIGPLEKQFVVANSDAAESADLGIFSVGARRWLRRKQRRYTCLAG